MAIKGRPVCSWLTLYTVLKITGIDAGNPNRTAEVKDKYKVKEMMIGLVSSIRIGRKRTTPKTNLRSARPVGPSGSRAPIAIARCFKIIFLYVSLVNIEKKKVATAKKFSVHSTHLQFFL